MNAQELVVSRPEDHIALLTLNRPETRNALNVSLLERMEDAIAMLEQETDLRVLIITGTGSSFCSGADLREIRDFDPQRSRQFSLLGHRVFNRVEQFPAPVVAAINGHALGGGCELACACDLRVATARARLGQPEARVGMITGWGATTRLPRYIGLARTKEMVFRAEVVSAEQAKQMGLVNRVFEDAVFTEEVLEYARTITRNAPIANALSKQMLNRHGVPAAHDESLALAYTVLSEDQSEAIDAFLEKREPLFRGR